MELPTSIFSGPSIFYLGLALCKYLNKVHLSMHGRDDGQGRDRESTFPQLARLGELSDGALSDLSTPT